MKKLLFPYKKNGCFYNNKYHQPESFVFGTLPAFLQSLCHRMQRIPTDEYPWMMQCQPVRASIIPVITWIGQSTFLIQVGNINILTDPVFGDLAWFHRRIFKPGVTLDRLPPIDCVLISHNHRDHMDEPSLMALKVINPRLRVMVPEGDKKWFDTRGFLHVVEFMWWDRLSLSAIGFTEASDISFTFLPAVHWSGRGFFDQNRSLWGSWLIEWDSYQIFFAGDSAYSPHFRLIGSEYPNIDIAIVPIGPCEPYEWMRRVHMDPKESLRAFLDLGARYLIPMHWGTFLQGTDVFDTPIKQLMSEWHNNSTTMHARDQSLQVLKIGQQVQLSKQSAQHGSQLAIIESAL